MNFELKALDFAGAAHQKADVLLVLVPDDLPQGSDVITGIAHTASRAGDLDTKTGSALALYQVPKVAATRLVLVACEDASARKVRQAIIGASVHWKSRKLKRLVLCFAAQPDASTLQVAMQAVADASYVYTTTCTKKDGRSLAHVTLGVASVAPLRAAFEQGAALVQGMEFAKEWANRPANYATPTMLGEAARSLASGARLSCEVLGPRQITKLGMGSFMAVARGSREEPRFIVLRYNGAAASQAPTVLVGKGITFDTGGISIKPAAEMDEMKYDMGGAASVLGVFKALSVLKPAVNVVGLIASCENMPDGLAVKPGDVVTSMSGQTIEILNTDAEGRLILCDALTYAERFKPRVVIDIATLTGASVIALGAVRSGMFATDEALASELLAAGDATLDLCWRMPLDDDYADGLKTNFADVANVAGRAAGSVTAAKFLQRFAGKFTWAHLDIAGTAWKSGAAKGATARPVPLLLSYLTGGATAAPAKKAPAKRAGAHGKSK